MKFKTATEISMFDETEYYNSEIIPIMEALQKACKAKNLPYVCSVVYRQNEEKTGLGVFMENNTRHGLGIVPIITAGKICRADISKASIAATLLTLAKLLDD